MNNKLKTEVLTTDDLELFKVVRNDKKPAVKHGLYSAKKYFDVEWTYMNGYNIGFKQEPMFIAIDMDEDDIKGYHGIEVIKNLEKELGPLPRTYTQSTPRGGLHKVFLAEGITKNVTGKITPAVDVKYRGYILFQGSQINGKYYHAIDGFNPQTREMFFSALPEKWIKYIENSNSKHESDKNNNFEYTPVVIDGDFKKMYDGCLFVQRCVDESATLSEPEWHLFARLLNNFTNGEELFVHYSQNHPDFDLEVTKEKFSYASKYPVNCKAIMDVSDACIICKLKKIGEKDEK